MPSVSAPQARLMAGVAHNPQFAQQVGIPQKVGQDFNQADTGTKLLADAMRKRRLKAENKARPGI